ncbi:alcohol dehydrogenase [Acetobacteraceae bacterium]|nr:alcohol dehydrogenase [Acetobacteraceae bacterium]
MHAILPEKMKAARFNHYGAPQKVLKIKEISIPEIKADEVLVKTILSPIHTHNCMLVSGTYGDKPTLPAGAGSEAVGTIVKIGANVSDLEIGDKVAYGACTETWAEYFTAPAEMAWKVPEGMKDELAAQISEMPLSAWLLCDFLEKKIPLSKNQWLVQDAAGGTVGKMLATLGEEKGFKILSLLRNKEQCKTLSEKGQQTVCTKDSDWIEQAKKIMNGANAAAAVDAVGGEAGKDLIDLLNEKGQLVLFGNLTGKPLPIEAGAFIFSHRIIRGFWATPLKKALKGEKRAAVFADLAAHIQDGRFELPVGGVYPLDEIQEALHANQSSGHEGKILLKM